MEPVLLQAESGGGLLGQLFPVIAFGLVYYFVFFKRAKEKARLEDERLSSIEKRMSDLESRINH